MGNPLPVNLAAECRKADKIIKDFVDPVNGLDRVIPLTVLRRAKGFAIFSIFRVGFVLTARAGSGVVIAKLPDGSWSAPSALGIAGVGGGFSAGAEVTDFIVVLNSRSAVKSFMATGSLQLGGNLSLAVGPLGRSAEASGALNSSGDVAAMFSYSKSQGLFGGVSLEGSALVDRSDANSKAYNRSITAKKILSGSVEVPAFAQGLIGTIERLSLTGRMSQSARADEIEPGAGRESWSNDSDHDDDGRHRDDYGNSPADADLYPSNRRTSSKPSSRNDGIENYFSQAELDSRQRKFEANGGGVGGGSSSSAFPSSSSSPSASRRTPPPKPSTARLPSSSSSSRDPFATSEDEEDPYSLDRDNATRNAGTYNFSSQGGGSITNSPAASRGGDTTPGGRKRSDSKASFKGAAAGYFDEYLSSKDKRAYSPIDGKRPTVGHRKTSSSFSIPKFGRKTPPAFGKPTDTLIPTTGGGNDAAFNEHFREGSDNDGHGFSSGDTVMSAHAWQQQREASPEAAAAATSAFGGGASDYGNESGAASRPRNTRQGSSSLFSLGGGGRNAAPPSELNGGLKKTTPADAVRAAAAAGGKPNDAFSDIWDAERTRASTARTTSSSYSNSGLDSLDEELQRGSSLRRNNDFNKGPSAGYTSFSDDRPASGGPPSTTSRFSPVNFFRTNSGGVKSAQGNAASNARTGSGGGFRTGSGGGFRSGSGGGFRSGSGAGFRVSSRNSNGNGNGTPTGGVGGLSNFVGVGGARGGGGGGGVGNSRLLDSSSEGEDDHHDLYQNHHRRQGRSSGSDEIGQIFDTTDNHDHVPHDVHNEDDWGLANLSVGGGGGGGGGATATITERVIASFDFAGQESDDLRFNRGDFIIVLKKTDSTNDWWLGKTADGRIGSFPANFVEMV